MKILRLWILNVFLGVAGASAQTQTMEGSEPVPSRSYAARAVGVDLLIVTGGAVLTSWQLNRPSTPYRGNTPWGLGVVGAGVVFGGVVSHGLHGNPDAQNASVKLRMKHLGLGTLYGLGAGTALGVGTLGVCAVAAGGYCALALTYGLVFGPVAGALGGMVRGMVLDYRTLARRLLEGTTERRLTIQPQVGLSPTGQVQLGLVGGF